MKSSQIISRDLTEAGVSIVNVGNTAFLRYSKVFLRKEEPAMSIPVAIVTDVDVRHYEKMEGDYVKRNDEDINQATVEKIKEKEAEFSDQVVKVFVAPLWTLEYSLLNSKSLSAKFKEVVPSIHSKTDFSDFEKELAIKLINKSLKKTEIAYQLAQIIDADAQAEIAYRKTDKPDEAGLPAPEITLDAEDDSIRYLVEAIKYACGN